MATVQIDEGSENMGNEDVVVDILRARIDALEERAKAAEERCEQRMRELILHCEKEKEDALERAERRERSLAIAVLLALAVAGLANAFGPEVGSVVKSITTEIVGPTK